MPDQWQYGSSWIAQMDADEHWCFIAEHYQGAIVVIEIPYANTNATRTHAIPGIAGEGSTPGVFLSTTKDAQTRRLDLVVAITNTSYQIVLYNTGSAFSQEQP